MAKKVKVSEDEMYATIMAKIGELKKSVEKFEENFRKYGRSMLGPAASGQSAEIVKGQASSIAVQAAEFSDYVQEVKVINPHLDN
ncbi:hypothetical protein J4476_00735 [Candidatus Woesearchaeota archaeon]|nr:MAG: hypothetical protein QT09_C0001G0026 [archaeon GW2011_AR18]MBS3161208.1 hypothetical protein [Candidatus Woesearchaeota archaeon]HIH25235.1 hypothetical protein [Nanoarchaeota archaeon]